VLALVTWGEREDPHWFGGRIPDTVKSVEFVQADTSGKLTSYRCYDGPGLRENNLVGDAAAKQAKFISTLAQAWMP
jgi:hypothetical protein